MSERDDVDWVMRQAGKRHTGRQPDKMRHADNKQATDRESSRKAVTPAKGGGRHGHTGRQAGRHVDGEKEHYTGIGRRETGSKTGKYICIST